MVFFCGDAERRRNVMIGEAVRPCPICGNRRASRLHTQRFVLDDGHPLADGYDVANCESCGFVYADVAATQGAYDAFYENLSKYDDPGSSTGSGESPLDRVRLEDTAEILAQALPGRDSHILDIGCAGGGLLEALSRRGYRNLAGIDPSAACARMTREKTGVAYQGWVTNLPPGIGTFDCVALSHVLEHVLDVPSAIAALPPLLREGGIAYVEIPDAARYADYVYAPFQDFNTEHINHFSRLCLDRAMARQGFTAVGGGERLLRDSPQTVTPSIYGLYRWTGAKAQFRPDTALKPAILRYIERSYALLNRIDRSIGEALEESPSLIVWGAGQLTLKLLAETRLSQARVIAFVDSNPIRQGRFLRGVPILAPRAIRAYPQPILIGSLLHHRQILEEIERLGLTNRVILLPEGGPRFFAEAHP
jgi:2-polyprenyl-3-methyl-5-hydroxy-6-metoxy-1,4-benzoquinol methylase